jgi:hypothetical protein
MDFRLLRGDEIDCRVNMVQSWGISLLLYKDARCDQNILDETVGPMNWQRDHKELKGNIYCGIGIWDDDKQQWIWKWDCGSESNTEKEKGEASDSFKRAGFNWGIGRELYTCPFVWFKATDVNIIPKGSGFTTRDPFEVNEIEYDGNKVSYLVITNKKTKKQFSWGTPQRAFEGLSPADRKKGELKTLLRKTDSDVTLFLIWCNKEFKREISAVDELKDSELDRAIAKVKQKEKK